jgi:hypothetical protein
MYGRHELVRVACLIVPRSRTFHSVDFVNGHYDGAPPIDVFPIEGSALVAVGATSYVLAYDFDG